MLQERRACLKLGPSPLRWSKARLARFARTSPSISAPYAVQPHGLIFAWNRDLERWVAVRVRMSASQILNLSSPQLMAASTNLIDADMSASCSCRSADDDCDVGLVNQADQDLNERRRATRFAAIKPHAACRFSTSRRAAPRHPRPAHSHQTSTLSLRVSASSSEPSACRARSSCAIHPSLTQSAS